MSRTIRRNRKTKKPERDGYITHNSIHCTHNNACSYCRRNRLNQAIRSETRAQDDIEEYYRGDHWDYLDEYEREVALAFDLDYEDLLRRDMDLELPETDWENYKAGRYDDP